jgi:hypothetical protein
MNFSVFLGIVLAAIAVRVAFHFFDKNRIQQEVETRGGRVVSIKWKPFARGWFFEKNERHYDITFIDGSGGTICTTCKTSFFTGLLGGRPIHGEKTSHRFMAPLYEMWLRDERRLDGLPALWSSCGQRVRSVMTERDHRFSL